jgi:hypothetical protein
MIYWLILLTVIPLIANASNTSISIKNINLSSFSTYKYLKSKGFKPRRDVEPWPFSTPIDWDADPFNDRNWQFQLHAWRLIDPIIREYHKTDNPKLLDEVLSIVTDWYDYHFIRNRESHMQWYDMATGIRAMKLAWIKQTLAENRTFSTQITREKINSLLEMHIEKLMDEKFLSTGNHAYFQLVGLRLACSVNESSHQCKNEQAYNNRMMERLLGKQFSDQGVHRENSPGYHVFTVSILKSLKIPDLYPENVMELIRKAGNITPWLVYPDATVARIGDSSGKYSKAPPIKGAIFNVNNEQVLIGDYIRSGYFTVRTSTNTPSQQSTQLFITGISNKDYVSHKHADELSFELFHKGVLVFLDSGKYSYNSNKFRKYIISASAHNTVSIEGTKISPKDVDRSGSKLINYKKSGDELIITGSVIRPGLLKHTREFYVRPFANLQIKDIVQNDFDISHKVKAWIDDYKFTSNLHLNPELEPTWVSEDTIRVKDLVDVKLISDNCELILVRGQTNPLLGWISFSYNDITPASVLKAQCPNVNKQQIIWNITLH